MGGYIARVRGRESPVVSEDEGEGEEEWYSLPDEEEYKDTGDGQASSPSKPTKPVSKRVRCPYSPDGNEHFTTEAKLMWHILKCDDYIQSKDNFVVCPYDAMHVFKKGEDMEEHISSQHSDQLAKISSVIEYFQNQPDENPWASDWPDLPAEPQENPLPEQEEIEAAAP